MSEREYPQRPVVGVGGVIVDAEGRVALVRRGREPLRGEWTLPGGALELGETLQTGVAREMLEETGLEVEVGPVVDVHDRVLPDGDGRIRYHYVLVDFLCRPRAGRLVAGSDVVDARWVDAAALPSWPVPEPVRAVVARALTLNRGLAW